MIEDKYPALALESKLFPVLRDDLIVDCRLGNVIQLVSLLDKSTVELSAVDCYIALLCDGTMSIREIVDNYAEENPQLDDAEAFVMERLSRYQTDGLISVRENITEEKLLPVNVRFTNFWHGFSMENFVITHALARLFRVIIPFSPIARYSDLENLGNLFQLHIISDFNPEIDASDTELGLTDPVQRIFIPCRDFDLDRVTSDIRFSPVPSSDADDAVMHVPAWQLYSAYEPGNREVGTTTSDGAYVLDNICYHIGKCLVEDDQRETTVSGLDQIEPSAADTTNLAAIPPMTIGLIAFDNAEDAIDLYGEISKAKDFDEAANEIMVVNNLIDATERDKLDKFFQEKTVTRVNFFEAYGAEAIDQVFRHARGIFALAVSSRVRLHEGWSSSILAYLNRDSDQEGLIFSSSIEQLRRESPITGFSDLAWQARTADGYSFISEHDFSLVGCVTLNWPGINPRLRSCLGIEAYLKRKALNFGQDFKHLDGLEYELRHETPPPTSLSTADELYDQLTIARELKLSIDAVANQYRLKHPSDIQEAYAEARLVFDNPLDYFDAIYCLNLDSATQRWEEMCSRFKFMNILPRVRRFSAYVTPESHHIGCAMSHRDMIAAGHSRNYKNILVLEDDCSILPDVIERLRTGLEYVRTQPWNKFFPGVCSRYFMYVGKQEFAADDVIRITRFVTCTHSIAYSSRIYDSMLAGIPKKRADYESWLSIAAAIDQGMNYYVRDQRYLMYPSVTSQDSIRTLEDPELVDEYI